MDISCFIYITYTHIVDLFHEKLITFLTNKHTKNTAKTVLILLSCHKFFSNKTVFISEAAVHFYIGKIIFGNFPVQYPWYISSR